MTHLCTRIPAAQLQSILFWLLLFLLSPYSTTGALASVFVGYYNVRLRRDGEPNISDQPNSSNDRDKHKGNGGGRNTSNRSNLHGDSGQNDHHGGLHKQRTAGIVIAFLPVLLLVILAVRWWRTRQHNKAEAAAAAVDLSSQAELAQKPQDTDSSIADREPPPLPHDTDSSDTDSNKPPTSQPPTQPLNYASTFVPVLPYPFDSNADRPSQSFTAPAIGNRRASAGDTYPNSTYFASASMTTSPTTPTKITFPPSRRASYINTTGSPPSPSQWLSRSPGPSRPRLSLQEDKVIGYRKRAEGGAAITDLSMSKNPHIQLPPVKDGVELPRSP